VVVAAASVVVFTVERYVGFYNVPPLLQEWWQYRPHIEATQGGLDGLREVNMPVAGKVAVVGQQFHARAWSMGVTGTGCLNSYPGSGRLLPGEVLQATVPRRPVTVFVNVPTVPIRPLRICLPSRTDSSTSRLRM
jgi:hypothetical protein